MAREMKDSGIQWLGAIPMDWEIIHLKYISDLKTGGTPRDKVGINDENDGFPWITAQDITLTMYIENFSQYISQTTVEKYNYQLFKPNSILLVCIASVGKVGMIFQEAYSNQQITALMPNNKIYPKYLLYYIKSAEQKLTFDASSNVVPIINSAYLNNFSCLLPDIDEQKKIADYLDKKCTEIDSLSSDIQTQIHILEDYKKSVITEAVTKGLNPDAEMKDSGIECIGEIPAHWRFMAVKRLTSVLTCGVASTPEYVDEDNGVLFLSAQNIQNNKLDLSIRKYVPISFHKALTKNRKPEKGDILQVRVGATIGKCAIVDIDEEFSVYVSLSHIRVNNNMHNRFLNYIIGTDMFKEMVSVDIDYAGTQGNLNVADLREVKIPVPPIQEQQAIAEYLDKKYAEIDAITTKKKEQLNILEQYKKSLIYEYVTGKREVPENNG